MKAQLTTKGFSELLEELARVGKDVDAAADEALIAGGDVVVEIMLAKAPELTGNLKAHIKRGEPVNSASLHIISVGVLDADADTARYANAQEFGTSSMPAHPYIRPATDGGMRQAKAAMKAVFLEKLQP